MYRWIVLGAIVLLLILLRPWFTSRYQGPAGVEGFDTDTLQAQRQLLQAEGERRYNDFARIQAPGVSISEQDSITLFNQTIALPTSRNAAGTALRGSSSGLSAADDGTGKVGQPVEQTGTIQQKVAFCESVNVQDCSQMNDPRMAECGICLRKGTDSMGNPHAGGLYISTADQKVANDIAARTGASPSYTPTLGSCAPADFVMSESYCAARKNQIACLGAGAPTGSNQCGQCYGGSGGPTGLLYVGPKPRPYSAVLWVSHPGGHSNGGAGLVLKAPAGTYRLPPSSQPLLDPQSLAIQITEGDQLSITVYGMPQVWCAWIESPDGRRSVSIDVGAQSIQPANGFVIAGDKQSGVVNSLMSQGQSAAGGWSSFAAKVPNTVLWYQRRGGYVPPMIVSGWYGLTPPNAPNAVGLDATAACKTAAGSGSAITVSTSLVGGTDPAPGSAKTLWITQDTGNVLTAGDGQVIPANSIANMMTMTVTVPATLAGPYYEMDAAQCATGPMVLTEVGAGLMGSHSCFTPTGAFNPTQYCLQELFTAAGGTQQGTGFPNSDAKVAAIVQKDATGAPSLDATTAYLNNLNNIATYGTDSTGASATFEQIQSATQFLTGQAATNPCETAFAATGPHTPACLDYLWRTSGSPSLDGQSVNPTTLPYAYCTANGSIAPLNADGTPNQQAVALLNQQGGVSAVRSFIQGIYNKANDPSDFYAQSAAMQNCFGTDVQPPQPTPSSCPPKNPTEFQCITPSMVQSPEVFSVCRGGIYQTPYASADAVCESLGARVASPDEVQAAQVQGAQWCNCSWTADANSYFPVQQRGYDGVFTGYCADKQFPQCDANNGTNKYCVNCFGVKPTQQELGSDSSEVLPWSSATGQWSANSIVALVPDSDNTKIMAQNQSAQFFAVPRSSVQPQAAALKMVAGINGSPNLVSFVSPYNSNNYMRHEGFTVWMRFLPMPSSYQNDSSFFVRAPLSNPGAAVTPGRFSLEASTLPGYFLSLSADRTTMALIQVNLSDATQCSLATWTTTELNEFGGVSGVPACAEINGTVVCAGTDPYTLKLFDTTADCNNYLSGLNGQPPPVTTNMSFTSGFLTNLFDTFIRGNV